MNYRILRVEPPPPETVSIARDVTFVRAHLDPHLTDPSSSAPHCSSSALPAQFSIGFDRGLLPSLTEGLSRFKAYRSRGDSIESVFRCFDPILAKGSSKRTK